MDSKTIMTLTFNSKTCELAYKGGEGNPFSIAAYHDAMSLWAYRTREVREKNEEHIHKALASARKKAAMDKQYRQLKSVKEQMAIVSRVAKPRLDRIERLRIGRLKAIYAKFPRQGSGWRLVEDAGEPALAAAA